MGGGALIESYDAYLRRLCVLAVLPLISMPVPTALLTILVFELLVQNAQNTEAGLALLPRADLCSWWVLAVDYCVVLLLLLARLYRTMTDEGACNATRAARRCCCARLALTWRPPRARLG